LIAASLFLGVTFIVSTGNVPVSGAHDLAVTPLAAPQAVLTRPQPVIEKERRLVPSGATITSLLGDYISPAEIHDLGQCSEQVFPFTSICAGRPYAIELKDHQFQRFVYEIDDQELLIISREGDEIRMEKEPIQYEVTTELVQGEIQTSLFDAVTSQGESPKLAYMLADIFQWDIDFILDIRTGDRFRALVEKRFRDGKTAGYGHIIAAEFVNQGHVFKAARYQDGDQPVSYYDEKGNNVRKAFLRAPLSFSRISSGFTMKRFHPITKTWKAHPAIDYVAPVGTPIKTVGDGVIARIGRNRFNGNFIEVRHSNGYRSIYLHMKGFARGMRLNQRVRQGQVIGYLGGTGMATGPHLCFRMKQNNAPVNPARLRASSTRSIAGKDLPAYRSLVMPLFAQLAGHHVNAGQVASLVPPE